MGIALAVPLNAKANRDDNRTLRIMVLPTVASLHIIQLVNA